MLSETEKLDIPRFSASQLEFIESHLVKGTPYAVIVEAFKKKFPDFVEPYLSRIEEFDENITDRLRNHKSRKLEDLQAAAKELIPIVDPIYRLKYLNDLIHELVPERVLEEGQRYVCNVGHIVKIIQLIEVIFKNMLGVDEEEIRQAMSDIPKLRDSDFFGKKDVDS